MAYSELIKKFENIRDYMREFYVYGFKSREEFDKKSARTYDNEKRRIESYLGDYMGFHQTTEGKNVFLSIDSRSVEQNPLYKALKAKSFTEKDITLHFILFDILYTPEILLSVKEIIQRMDTDYLACFEETVLLDESTVRKKLKEYIELGLIRKEKRGRQIFYGRAAEQEFRLSQDVLEFFSEVGLCGVIGSYLLDKTEGHKSIFRFKHHYITHALESEVLWNLLEAISGRRTVQLGYYSRKYEEERQWEVLPLKIFISVQNGRRYLFGYNFRTREIKSYRLDYITTVKMGKTFGEFEEYRKKLNKIQKHMWGVIFHPKKPLEHVEFTVYLGEGEEYIYHRLEREKRCGTIERINRNHCRFVAEVYDTNEMVPWIRTFICRITSLNFSNRTVENRFRKDLENMYRLYEVGGED